MTFYFSFRKSNYMASNAITPRLTMHLELQIFLFNLWHPSNLSKSPSQTSLSENHFLLFFSKIIIGRIRVSLSISIKNDFKLKLINVYFLSLNLLNIRNVHVHIKFFTLMSKMSSQAWRRSRWYINKKGNSDI